MLKVEPVSKKRWPLILLASFAIVVPLTYFLVVLNLPLPAPVVDQKIFTQQVNTKQEQPLPWPDADQATIYVPSQNIKQSYGQPELHSTASVAKAITALAILQKMPLALGEQGPQITMTAADEALYKQFVADGGSVFAVNAGDKLTQYEALQALMLPSANNMAATLTRWAFGSDASYLDYANAMVKDLGMNNTVVADASGFSAATKSTTEDLVILGKAAHDNPVLAQIVNQKSAQISGRQVNNVNTSLGVASIDGIKTGFTFAAGGCLLFSATQDVFGKPTTLIGAILGTTTRDIALAAAPNMVESGFSNFIQVEPLQKNQIVANVNTAWGEYSTITSVDTLQSVVWKGSPLDLQIILDKQKLSGQAKLADKTTSLVLTNPLKKPDIWWRLTHPQILVSNYVQSL